MTSALAATGDTNPSDVTYDVTYIPNLQARFVHQGHRVKVKVTRVKSVLVHSVCGWSAFQ